MHWRPTVLLYLEALQVCETKRSNDICTIARAPLSVRKASSFSRTIWQCYTEVFEIFNTFNADIILVQLRRYSID